MEKLFTSKTRVSLLNQFLLNPGEYHIREVSRIVGASPILVQKELRNLEQFGLLTRREVGKMILYSLNKGSCIADDLKRVFMKTDGLGAQILAGFSKENLTGIRFALIFGSFAKNTETTSSDVDLFVVGNIRSSSVMRVVGGIEKELLREIHLVLWTEQEFHAKVEEGIPLIREIAKTPVIMIVGDLDEFKRIVERREDRAV